MAHLACVGSHSINGVAKLHSEQLVRGGQRIYLVDPVKMRLLARVDVRGGFLQ